MTVVVVNYNRRLLQVLVDSRQQAQNLMFGNNKPAQIKQCLINTGTTFFMRYCFFDLMNIVTVQSTNLSIFLLISYERNGVQVIDPTKRRGVSRLGINFAERIKSVFLSVFKFCLFLNVPFSFCIFVLLPFSSPLFFL